MPASERELSFELMLLALEESPDGASFKNDPSLAFAPRDIASAALDPLTFAPAFIGLLGASGTLPYHYTERLLRLGDPAPLAFIDLLSARSVALYCEAWRKQRPEYGGFDAALLALAGVAGDAPHWPAFHAGRMRQATLPADAMGEIIAEHFGVPVRVQQFAGAWDALPLQHRWQLGCANSTLGAGMALGGCIWRRDTRVAVALGPLGRDDFERLLPGGAGAAALCAMVEGFEIAPLQCELRLELADEALPAPVLGGIRLGFDACLGRSGSFEKIDDRTVIFPFFFSM
jgi:type VI secretion system protein ImpH